MKMGFIKNSKKVSYKIKLTISVVNIYIISELLLNN